MKRINVTKTFLPQIAEYQDYLSQIWDRDLLTNQGPLLKEFERQAGNYLDVKNFQFVSNGTMALQLSLRALNIEQGEVITTPFSYVATTSAILWEGFTPIFADIDPATFCIDPDKIEASITEKTRAILAVHVFGNACNIEKIQSIARQHNLPVIYDGAHAFGAKYNNKSLLSFGDISICSFHAAKSFHTIEGGCVISSDKAISDQVELQKRFGHDGDDHIMLGINGKASEFQAAMGLCNLKYVDAIIEKRGVLSKLYDELLGQAFQRPMLQAGTKPNYGYYPVLFASEPSLLRVVARLNKADVFPRRYFYPSLNTLPYLPNRQSCPVSEDIARRVLCLPLYDGLKPDNVKVICEVISR